MSLICDAHDALLCNNEDHRTSKLNASKTKLIKVFILLPHGLVTVIAFTKFDTDKISNIIITQFVQL